MPENKKRVGVFFGEDAQLDVLLEGTAQIDQLAFTVVGSGHARDQSGVGEARRNAPRNLGGRGALGDILNTAIRQCDVNLLHGRGHLKRETSSLSAAHSPVKAEPMAERC